VYDRAAAWIESVHPEDREGVLRMFAGSQRGETAEMEYRIIRPDGAVRWIHNRAYPVQDATGAFYRIVGVAEDITARKRTEQMLEEGLARTKEAHEKLAAALRKAEAQAKDTALVTELIDVVQACPTVDEAYAVTGSMLAEFFPAQPGALSVTRSSRNVVEVVATWGDRAVTAKTFGPDDCWALRRGRLHVVHDASASTRCGHLSDGLAGGAICVPLAAHGETLGVLCVERPAQPGDATADGAQDDGDAGVLRVAIVAERLSLALANVQLRETLRRQSIRDPLTGLFNRRFMEESLERELQRAARSREPVTVLMLDLDHFKRFNDTYGHPAGDAFLRALGQFLAERVRGQDLACRYGGEEFLVILVGTSAEDARRRADTWREGCRDLTVQYAGRSFEGITLSVGIATYPIHGVSGERLVAAADQALYRAKAEGRDRVLIADGGPSVAAARPDSA
jgi:diguanylate cyclase (GGDEF)-like protein